MRWTKERLKDCTVETPNGCWEWQGAVNVNGYGVVMIAGKLQPVHRLAYTLFHRSIPNGYLIHHRCHNRRCVNPEHIEAVTSTHNCSTEHRHFKGDEFTLDEPSTDELPGLLVVELPSRTIAMLDAYCKRSGLRRESAVNVAICNLSQLEVLQEHLGYGRTETIRHAIRLTCHHYGLLQPKEEQQK